MRKDVSETKTKEGSRMNNVTVILVTDLSNFRVLVT